MRVTKTLCLTLGLTLGMVMSLALPQTVKADGHLDANAERLKISDVHWYFADFNAAMNGGNTVKRQQNLYALLAKNAVFNENIYNSYNNNTCWQNNAYHNRWSSHSPTRHIPANMKSYMSKSDLIAMNESKHRSVPGYRTHYEVKNIYMPASALTATVDVTRTEYVGTYSPYWYSHSGHRPYTQSSCKAYLDKYLDKIYLVRMDCAASYSGGGGWYQH